MGASSSSGGGTSGMSTGSDTGGDAGGTGRRNRAARASKG
jgi:hypothetical protein